MRAARTGDEAMALRALAKGADPARRDDAGEDAIRVAIAEASHREAWPGAPARHLEVVELLAPLVDGGALDDWGLTVLGRAVRSGSSECARAVLPWADLAVLVDGNLTHRELAAREEEPEIAAMIEAERARREKEELSRVLPAAAGAKRPKGL